MSLLTSDSVCCDIKELMTKETFPVKDLLNNALKRFVFSLITLR